MAPIDTSASAAPRKRWSRQLDQYPSSGVRYTSLATVVVATVVLYYQLYLSGGVAIHIMAYYHMGFAPFVYLNVASLVVAGVFAEAAHVVDKYGRANVITIGMFVVSLLCIFGIPNAHSKASFTVMFIILNACEGVILVATPAVVRDFSPQVGRASAMGFWTMGPVLGSVVVTAVVGTASDSQTWQHKFVVSGIVGLVVGVITIFGLKELAPALRDQVMVDEHDRVLVEAKMRGLDLESSVKNPVRQMLKPDILLSGLAISLFLVFYISLVAFGPTFFQIVFNYKEQDANKVLIFAWVANATGLVFWGFVSDKLRVRKPFMLIGGIGSLIFMILFALKATHFGTSAVPFYQELLPSGHISGISHPLFGTLAFLVAACLFFAGMAYVTWMASFTETVERRNPALTATGLAVWGFLIRGIFAVALVIMPAVISSSSAIVDNPGGLTIDGGRGHTVGVMVNGIDPRLTTAENQGVQLVLGAAQGKLPTLSAAQNQGVSLVANAGTGSLPTLSAAQNKAVALILSSGQGENPTLNATENAAVKAIANDPSIVTKVQTLAGTYADQLKTEAAIDPTTLGTLAVNPTDAAAQAKAVGDIASALKVSPQVAIAKLTALGAVPKADLLYLQQYGAPLKDPKVLATLGAMQTGLKDSAVAKTVGDVKAAIADPAVAKTIGEVQTAMTDPKIAANVGYVSKNAPTVLPAVAKAPKQWQNYWWICVAGAVIFIPMIWLMAGFWSPRKARAAQEKHDAEVAAELARLHAN